jgi:hypothetical protein
MISIQFKQWNNNAKRFNVIGEKFHFISDIVLSTPSFSADRIPYYMNEYVVLNIHSKIFQGFETI